MIKKVALALVMSVRWLSPYFQSHQIVVKTDQPIRQVLYKPKLAGRLIAWSIKLSKFDIQFKPRGLVKAQALADFLADFTTADTKPWWTLYVDEASSVNSSGAGILVDGPSGITL